MQLGRYLRGTPALSPTHLHDLPDVTLDDVEVVLVVRAQQRAHKEATAAVDKHDLGSLVELRAKVVEVDVESLVEAAMVLGQQQPCEALVHNLDVLEQALGGQGIVGCLQQRPGSRVAINRKPEPECTCPSTGVSDPGPEK